MRDEEKTREELIRELQETRVEVARLEAELLKSCRECHDLTAELDDKYEKIKWHDSMLLNKVEELNEKNIQLVESNRQLRRKKRTVRILAALAAVSLLMAGAAVALGNFVQRTVAIHKFEDKSYRPMDLERSGNPHPIKTGSEPIRKQEGKR